MRVLVVVVVGGGGGGVGNGWVRKIVKCGLILII